MLIRAIRSSSRKEAVNERARQTRHGNHEDARPAGLRADSRFRDTLFDLGQGDSVPDLGVERRAEGQPGWPRTRSPPTSSARTQSRRTLTPSTPLSASPSRTACGCHRRNASASGEVNCRSVSETRARWAQAQGNHWLAASARARWSANRRRTSSMAVARGKMSGVTNWSVSSAPIGCQ